MLKTTFSYVTRRALFSHAKKSAKKILLEFRLSGTLLSCIGDIPRSLKKTDDSLAKIIRTVLF